MQLRRIRNKLTTAQRNAQAQFEINLAAECSTNPRAFFRYADSRLNTRSRIPCLLLPDGATTQNPSETANVLNNYFSSVFTGSATTNTAILSDCLQASTQFTFDSSRVQSHLSQLPIHKACGPDGITHQVLKNNSTVLAPFLSALFQLSLDSGKVPGEWKDAHVTPIHKAGRLDLPENYRPISLLSCVSKIMERFVYDWVNEYLCQHSPLHASQHGFQRAQSCIHLNFWNF